VPSPTILNFMRQQGFPEEPADACNMHFEGLYFQPRIVFPAVLVAIVLQSAWLHLLIFAVLAWNTLLPAFNPFELAYNRWIAAPRGRKLLDPAPGPRRMAQGMAAALSLGAGVGLLAGAAEFAWIMEAGLVVGFSALLFGKFCIGAYLFHLIKGRVAFANATLPWARPRQG
jgi:Domain of unknown function (DUF4395)